MKSKEEIVREYERTRPVDRTASSPAGIRITGITIPFGDIVVLSLKIAIVWAVLGAVAWGIVIAVN